MHKRHDDISEAKLFFILWLVISSLVILAWTA